MVFDWKKVPEDEKILTSVLTPIAKNNNLKVIKFAELKLNDWLQIELHGVPLIDTVKFSVIRKVHKKSNYPREWFGYHKNQENEIFMQKSNDLVNHLIENGLIEKSIETYKEITEGVNAEYYRNTVRRLWSLLIDKHENIMEISVVEPTMRMVTIVDIILNMINVSIGEKKVPTQVISLSSEFPMMPLSILIGEPFMSKGFIPLIWTMNYPAYLGELILIRIPKEFFDEIEKVIRSLLTFMLSGNKQALILDQVSIYPVEKGLLRYILQPSVQISFYVTDRGIFFEKPIEYKWYIKLNFDFTPYDAGYLYNMGARDYQTIINPMLLSL